jgi:hypothetical protein
MVAWLIGLNSRDMDFDQLVESALDVFEQGMAQTMTPTAASPIDNAKWS